MTSNELSRLSPVIAKAAKSVAFQWPGVIDADDVGQLIYIRLLESPGSVEKISGMEDRAQYRAIVGIGHQLASEERTQYDHFKGSYRYSVHEVKDLLKKGILTNAPQRFEAERQDLEVAFQRLSVQYSDAITDRYVYEQTPSNTTERHALERGLTALADGMNKAHRTQFSVRDDGPGTRQILSRAEALDLSGIEWDGERDG